MAANASNDAATCSIRMLQPLLAALDEWGTDSAAVLAAAGLERGDFDGPERRISHAQYQATWLAAEADSGDATLGLHVVEHEQGHVDGLLAYIALTAPTRLEAYERARRYTRIAHDALELELHFDGDRTLCETRFRGQPSVPVVAQYAVGLIVKIAPRVVGEQPLSEAWFRHDASAHVAEYERVLGIQVRFAAPFDAVVSTGESLDAPLPRSDAGLAELLEEQAMEKLARIPSGDDFAENVRQRIAAALPKGDPTAEGVAAALGVSARTLRRRLAAQGLSHQQQLDAVRCELAQRALAQHGANVSEVAYQLGFSDASAFHKAFRRWTGKRPSDVVAGRART